MSSWLDKWASLWENMFVKYLKQNSTGQTVHLLGNGHLIFMGWGQEDVFGPGTVFHPRHNPAFSFIFIEMQRVQHSTIELILSWIKKFPQKFSPGFFFLENLSPQLPKQIAVPSVQVATPLSFAAKKVWCCLAICNCSYFPTLVLTTGFWYCLHKFLAIAYLLLCSILWLASLVDQFEFSLVGNILHKLNMHCVLADHIKASPYAEIWFEDMNHVPNIEHRFLGVSFPAVLDGQLVLYN